jgi:hypothetical protein
MISPAHFMHRPCSGKDGGQVSVGVEPGELVA